MPNGELTIVKDAGGQYGVSPSNLDAVNQIIQRAHTAIKTVQGDTLTVGSNLAITDQRARTSNIVATDVLTSNGVIHVIDKVILPKP